MHDAGTTTASSEALRWTASNTNRGTEDACAPAHVGDAERDADRQQDQRDGARSRGSGTRARSARRPGDVMAR